MNKEEILAIEAGRELDALVAVRVMGWEKRQLQMSNLEYWFNPNGEDHISMPWIKDWTPSTDISAAWEVIEEMQSKTNHFSLQQGLDLFWVATFYAGSHYSKESTAPKAICKAALLALIDS